MSDRKLNIRYSKDGCHNWSDWREIPLGELGDFQAPVIARRFGIGRQFVFDIEITSPIRADLIAASAEIERLDG